MCRANALTAVKRAGSGHLGSSFSALDLVVHLLFEELNVAELGWEHPDRDVFFSSKGHDVPGSLRGAARARCDPDRAPAAAAAARRARRASGRRRAGDRGELRLARDGDLEGSRDRLGEALPRARRPRRRDGRRRRAAGGTELRGAAGRRAPARRPALGGRRPERAAVGQADGGDPRARRPRGEARRVRLARRDAATGTTTRRCARCSTRFRAGRRAAEGARRAHDQGQGRLVHGASGCACARAAARIAGTPARPSDEDFARAHAELVATDRRAACRDSVSRRSRSSRCRRSSELRRSRCRASRSRGRSARGAAAGDGRVRRRGLRRGAARAGRDRTPSSSSSTAISPPTAACAPSSSPTPRASSRTGSPSRTWSRWPAGSPATGCCPVVNSFASFLASRANEQIYNNASERTKVDLRAALRGADPRRARASRTRACATSRCSARCRTAPSCSPATRRRRGRSSRWAVEEATENVAIRLAIGPSPRRIELPAGLAAASRVAAPSCTRATTRCSSRTGR